MKLAHWILVTSALLLGCSSDPEPSPPAKPDLVTADAGIDPLAPPPSRQATPPRRRGARSGTPAGPGVLPLRPAPAPPTARRSESGLVTIALHDVEVRAAVEMLAELAGVQIDLTPWARGRVALTLTAKPWRYALTRLLVGLGEFDVLGNGDRVRVVPRQLRIVGTIVRIDADALVVNDGKQTLTLQLPSNAAGAETARRREDLLRALRGSQPGDRVVCGVAYVQQSRHLTAVLTRPATGADPDLPPRAPAPAATKAPPTVVPF